MLDPIRLLLVDRPGLFRHCLTAMLNRKRGVRVVGAADTGAQTLELARALQPHVAVVEPEVPEGGAKLIGALCGELPGCAVLVLTGSRDDGVASRVLQAGARGYLRKDCSLGELAQAIERVRAGDLVIAAPVAGAIVRGLGGEGPRESDHAGLTARELEVLRLVAQGKTNPEIARDLCITEHTVKGHLAKISAKLELNNRVQLATYATQRGLALPPATPAPAGTP